MIGLVCLFNLITPAGVQVREPGFMGSPHNALSRATQTERNGISPLSKFMFTLITVILPYLLITNAARIFWNIELG